MSIEDNGGPAFPAQFWDERATGMTLRDYFAAKVLQAMIPGIVDTGRPSWEDFIAAVAQDAYSYADAMLEARKK